MLGAVDRSHAVRVIEAVASGDGIALLGAVDGLRQLGLSAAGLLDEVAATLQRMAVLQAVPEAADASDPDAPQQARLAALLAPDATQLFYSIALRGREELPLAPDEYAGLAMVLLRMLAFAPPRTGRQAPRSERSAPLEPAAVEASEAAPAPDAALGDRWAAIVARLIEGNAIAALVRELALQAQCVAIDGDLWRLKVERESLRAPAQVHKLQAALEQLLGRPLRLEIEAGAVADCPAQREAAAREQAQREAERIIHDDPFVQSMLQQYKSARIVPGSIKPSLQ
jgi:DNA polymerase-3 subunit gamma/tau